MTFEPSSTPPAPRDLIARAIHATTWDGDPGETFDETYDSDRERAFKQADAALAALAEAGYVAVPVSAIEARLAVLVDNDCNPWVALGNEADTELWLTSLLPGQELTDG